MNVKMRQVAVCGILLCVALLLGNAIHLYAAPAQDHGAQKEGIHKDGPHKDEGQQHGAHEHGAQNRAEQKAADFVQKWEHLAFEAEGVVVKGNREMAAQIIRLGNDGWELVDVETIEKDGTSERIVYFFKRPK